MRRPRPGPSGPSVSQDAAASHAAILRQGVCRLAVFLPARLLPGRILQRCQTGADFRFLRPSRFLLKIRVMCHSVDALILRQACRTQSG